MYLLSLLSLDRKKIFGYILGIFIIIIGIFLHINDLNNVIISKKITKVISKDGKTCDKHTNIHASRYNVSVSDNYSCIIYVDNINNPIEVNKSPVSYSIGQSIKVYYDKNDINKKLYLYNGNSMKYFFYFFGTCILLFTHFGKKIRQNHPNYKYPLIHLTDSFNNGYGPTYSVSF